MSSSQLSVRLQTLIGMIEQGSDTLWDIGCDHGQLGLHAPELCSWIKEVHLVDPSSAVIDNLRKTIGAHIPKALVKINLHHQNGESLNVPTLNNVFVMAGMGGKTVLRILRHLREVSAVNDQFIISPNRDILQVRAALHAEGWGLLQETLVEEDGQFYQQLSLTKIRKSRPVSLYGEDFWQTASGTRYKSRMLEFLPNHRDATTQGFVRFLRS